MQASVEKWGDGLGLRIPADVAAKAGLSEQSVVDIALVEGKLVVAPHGKRALTLEELLAEVTEQNLHGEVDTGPLVGGEVG